MNNKPIFHRFAHKLNGKFCLSYFKLLHYILTSSIFCFKVLLESAQEASERKNRLSKDPPNHSDHFQHSPCLSGSPYT